MRTQKNVAKLSGFTLVELMAVVLIIVVLAGITIAALPGIQSKINRGQVESFIAKLAAGLDRYEIDNGMFPINEPSGSDPSTRDSDGVGGAVVLYKYLSGDFNMNGTVFNSDGDRDPRDEGFNIYINNLDGDYNKTAKEPTSISNPSGTGYLVVDGYNSEIRYLAEKPNKKGDKLTRNPTYDIWSITDTDPSRASDPKAQAKYITNWRRN